MLRWDGVLYSKQLKADFAAPRNLCAFLAETGNWKDYLETRKKTYTSINAWKLDDPSLNTPLHFAAENNAPLEVVREMVSQGAWRSLINAAGERPCDIARRNGNLELAEALQPAFLLPVKPGEIEKIQARIHRIIMGRAEIFLQRFPLRLPEISVILEMPRLSIWFSIYGGMYGGFGLDFGHRDGLFLVSSSWSRVIGGSGRRHRVTQDSDELVESGFV